MVYYIRFVKAPKFDKSKGLVRALVKITNDLGDDFYPGSLTLFATVVTSPRENDWQSSWQKVEWKRGMRMVWIEISDLMSSPSELLRLVVNTRPSFTADDVSLGNMPEVLSVRSSSFGENGKLEITQANDRVERRYRTSIGEERTIGEEMGESIARHIWDAGITLVAYLGHTISQPIQSSPFAKVLKQPGLDIIELGSGTGIAGLELARLCPTSDVLLTDHPEAMDLLEYNLSKAKCSLADSIVTARSLDWDDALPYEISRMHFDVAVVSDCTYNSDSIPALVGTLTALIEISPDAHIIVSMKRRHESEAIFFDLMAEAGFAVIECTKVPLPDKHRKGLELELETIEIFVFGEKK